MLPEAVSSSPQQVLLTGHDGFTGRVIAAQLRAHGLCVVPGDFDLRDRSSIERYLRGKEIDYVIHLAAISFVAHDSPASFYEVNTVGTENLLLALAATNASIRNVILASSAQVYGDHGEVNLDETSPCFPTTHYGCSKLAMECISRSFLDRLPITLVRPFNYTGPGQSEQFLVPKIVAHHKRGESVLALGNLDVVRDFLDVSVVADAYVRLLTVPGHGQVFNICSGRGKSLHEIVLDVQNVSGRRLAIVSVPELHRRSDIRYLVGCNRKLVEVIGPLLNFGFTHTVKTLLDDIG